MGQSVGAPHSSPFTKLAQRPKNNPIGAAMAPKSAKVRKGMRVSFAATAPPASSPTRPPWKLIPPWLKARISIGWLK